MFFFRPGDHNGSNFVTHTDSGTMIFILLLLSIIHSRFCVVIGYDVRIAEKIFLTNLGLSQRPTIGKNIYIPQETMELYESVQKQQSDIESVNFPLPGLHTKSANTARTYIDKGSAPRNKNSQRYRLQFDLKPLPENEQVKAAELRFTVRFPELRNELVVLIHDIIQPGIKGLTKPILRLMDLKMINTSQISKLDVMSFDVTPALERLSVENFQNNHGIIVQCLTGASAKDRQINVLDVFHLETFKPLLMVYTDDGTNVNAESMVAKLKRRRKRSDEPQPTMRKKPKKKICQRYPLYVDFKEVGFNDWIQAPQGYDAYYCHGECTFPLANHMNASNHAVMQTLMNSVNPSVVPRACCVPTKLSTQTLLYVDDEGKLVVKNYPEMVVEECGCR